MARSGFDVRFGYLRWLRYLTDGEPPSFAEIGKAVGGDDPLVGQTVSGWARRDTATDSRKNNRGLAVYFGVSEAWLVDGEGEAPRPELWRVWVAARTAPKHPLPKLSRELGGAPRSSERQDKPRPAKGR